MTAQSETPAIVLAIVALLPAIALLFYIYMKDRVEKEPIGLLLLLLGAGVFCCFPAMLLEVGIGSIIESIFSGSVTVTDQGISYTNYSDLLRYSFVENFFGVALIEEGLKFAALLLITRKNKNFNSYFDGLIYAVFVSLGFAAFENVLYAFSFDLGTALLRAVTSIPGHMFFAVFMGFFYTRWKVASEAKIIETALVSNGVIGYEGKGISTGSFLALALIIPVCIHGFYDLACSMGEWSWTVIFFVFLAALYFLAFRKVRQMSKQDCAIVTASVSFLAFKNSQYRQHLAECLETAGNFVNNAGYNPANNVGFNQTNNGGFNQTNNAGYNPANNGGFNQTNNAECNPVNNGFAAENKVDEGKSDKSNNFTE